MGRMADDLEDFGPALTLPPSWNTETVLFHHVINCARCRFVLMLGWTRRPPVDNTRRRRPEPGA